MNKPTESELDILQILWDRGPSTVREVHDLLLLKKETGYTTTLKLMQIMFEKQLLKRDDSSRTHIYQSAFSQNTGQKQAVNKLIDTLFKGSSAKLVMHALGNHQASKEEIEEIKKYLQQLESPSKSKQE